MLIQSKSGDRPLDLESGISGHVHGIEAFV